MWLWIILGSVLSGVLYRLGGHGKPWNTKVRDFGCPIVAWAVLTYAMELNFLWWIHLISGLLLFGALTTYWDKVFRKDNFYAHGFMCGLAYFPYCFDELSILWMLARAVVLGVLMGVWCHILFTNDVTEEVGRGAFIVLTLPLLLL